MKSKITILIKLIVSVLLLVFLINQAGTRELLTELKKASPFFFTLMVIIGLLRQFVGGWRWRYILGNAGNIDASILTTTKIYFVSIFMSNFLPGANTGDVIRPFCLKNLEAGRQKFVLATIIYERFLGLISIILLAIIGAIFMAWRDKIVYLNLIGSVIAIIGLMVFLYRYLSNVKIFQRGLLKKFIDAINYIFDQIEYMLRQRKMTVIVFIISVFYQIIFIVMYWLNSIALHANVSFFVIFLAVPLGWLATMIPVSLNGLGLREGLMCFVLKEFGIPIETSLAIALLFLPALAFYSFIGAFFFMTIRLKIRH
ncbi:MAG: lysylphosphatidylglycerol synthase transmembrane domain-containing protein [Candidatus Scalinduaceae bacterium]